MMNILPRNPVDREVKSPCDKNIRYPVCVPGHDSPNGTTFLTILVYDKQKTALVDDPSDLISTLLVWLGHLDQSLGRFSYYISQAFSHHKVRKFRTSLGNSWHTCTCADRKTRLEPSASFLVSPVLRAKSVRTLDDKLGPARYGNTILTVRTSLYKSHITEWSHIESSPLSLFAMASRPTWGSYARRQSTQELPTPMNAVNS
jgi:hypothetical protein